MGNYSVYMHTNKENGKKYIGITQLSPEKRWRDGLGYYNNKYFTSAIKKHGWDGFEHEVLYSGLSIESACAIEKELIGKYRSNLPPYGYNHSTGGELPAVGHTYEPTAETRRKIGDANRGKTRSEQTKNRISAAKKGRSNGLTGRIGNLCTRAKKIYQISTSGEVIGVFYGIGEIARIKRYRSPSKIGEVCRGTRKTAYGYIWKYEEAMEKDVSV